MGKGILGLVIAGALTVGGFATAPANANDDRQPVTAAVYRVEQAAPSERATTDRTPAKIGSQPTGGILKAELERWRGGGPAMEIVTAKADEIRVPVKRAIYRVEQPDPDEQATTEASADDEDDLQATGTDLKIDLVRWGRRWGGGWGGGYRRFGWGGGYRRFGWGGYRGYGWGGGFGYRRFAYRRFYRPYMYGFGYGGGYGGYGGGYGYGGGGYGGYGCCGTGYGGYGYGGNSLAYGGGYGYPGYGGGYYY